MNALVSTLVAVSGLLYSIAALADSAMTLYYEERAPYQMRVGDGVEGLTATPAARAFKAAGVPFVWEASSMSRQWILMRENLGPHCLVGWFKTGERQAFAKFTKPIYRDGPRVALVRRAFALGPVRTLAAVLSTPGLRLLVRSKYSYGPDFDGALARIKPVTIVSPLPNAQLTELLAANRADLMFASEEEASLLLRRLGSKAEQLQELRFSDVLPGSERYIVCSRSVPDETIARLNKAITFK